MVPNPSENKVETVSADYVPASIKISIFDPSAYFSTPTTSKDYIEGNGGGVRSKYFKLLERSPITVSGIKGEMIYYVDEWGLLVPKNEGVKLQYVKEVYFDYDGLVWNLKAKSEEEMVDQVNAYFDHVLETFKILGSPNSEGVKSPSQTAGK